VDNRTWPPSFTNLEGFEETMDQEIRLDPAAEELLLDLSRAEPDLIAYEPAEEHIASRGLLGAAWWQIAIKRTLDITISALAILVLTPLLLAVAILVKVTSRGPVFYVQQRVGRGGKPFRMIKFRSMHQDAHDIRDEHVENNIHVGPIFKIRDDPRVTSVGRVIRRLSIDELPQLFNVLMGGMSLVGPRPPLPEEFLDYTERERQRLLVKPGVTCIWQVSGRSDLDFNTWVDMDLEYIETWSLRLDIRLLAKTVPAVLTGRGAY
jgi:lipopolysaccharide/colanic/teichoic acid biosynthesis glycosyltransferase